MPLLTEQCSHEVDCLELVAAGTSVLRRAKELLVLCGSVDAGRQACECCRHVSCDQLCSCLLLRNMLAGQEADSAVCQPSAGAVSCWGFVSGRLSCWCAASWTATHSDYFFLRKLKTLVVLRSKTPVHLICPVLPKLVCMWPGSTEGRPLCPSTDCVTADLACVLHAVHLRTKRARHMLETTADFRSLYRSPFHETG